MGQILLATMVFVLAFEQRLSDWAIVDDEMDTVSATA
jgi:hypothetical protein